MSLVLSVFVACGGGSSSSTTSSSGASLASSDIATKEFISIIRNEDRINCEVLQATIGTFGAFREPIVGIESNTITCADYGREGDRKCSVIDLEIDGTIACVTGHNGSI